KRERPALTILDITMPRQDGIETLRQIRSIDTDAKVVMCSAIGQEKQIIKAVQGGAADYIVKPFKPENMLKVVKSVLG
ncbi:MAG: response regulator, partial [Synergistaceae bacterium]